MKFKMWLESQVTYNYDRQSFVSLPWNWSLLQKSGVVNALYYYADEGDLQDEEFSLITSSNIKSIPPQQLSRQNRTTGNEPDQSNFLAMLRNLQTWYDDKIDQVYQGIEMLGKEPEDFGGKDIRSN